MKVSEIKQILINVDYDLNKASAILDISVEELKEVMAQYKLEKIQEIKKELDEKPPEIKKELDEKLPDVKNKIVQKPSFKDEVLKNMEKFIDERYLVAKILKSNILKKVETKVLDITDPQVLNVLKYIDDIYSDCFKLAEKYKINVNNKLV